MDAKSTIVEANDDSASNRRVWMIIGILAVVFFAFLDNVLGYGGMFSIKAALEASNGRLPFVDVDGAGLRTIFMTPMIIAIMGACAYFNVDVKNRVLSALIILTMIGGGFILDAVYDESIMTHILQRRGYARCETRDHEVGNGKSRVWFHNYVLRVADCSTQEPSAISKRRLPAA